MADKTTKTTEKVLDAAETAVENRGLIVRIVQAFASLFRRRRG